MSGWFIFYAIAWACAFGSVGSYMGGQLKGQPTLGFVLGLLLGPLGLLLVFAFEDVRPKCGQCKMAVPEGAKKCGHCGADIVSVSQAALPSRQSELAITTQRKCPSCGSSLDGRYPKCRHCSADILWIAGCPTGCGHAFLIEPAMNGESVACPKCKHSYSIDDSLPAKASTKVRAQADAKLLLTAIQRDIQYRDEKTLPCSVCNTANMFSRNEGSGVCETCKRRALQSERYDRMITKVFICLCVIAITVFFLAVAVVIRTNLKSRSSGYLKAGERFANRFDK